MTIFYNKLVRDKIPAIIEKNGEKPLWHVATTREYETELLKKLLEEAQEFIQDGSIEEFADIEEVMAAIASLRGFTKQRVAKVRTAKALARGRFKKRIILEEV